MRRLAYRWEEGEGRSRHLDGVPALGPMTIAWELFGVPMKQWCKDSGVSVRSSLDDSTEQPELRTSEARGQDGQRGLGTETKKQE